MKWCGLVLFCDRNYFKREYVDLHERIEVLETNYVSERLEAALRGFEGGCK